MYGCAFAQGTVSNSLSLVGVDSSYFPGVEHERFVVRPTRFSLFRVFRVFRGSLHLAGLVEMRPAFAATSKGAGVSAATSVNLLTP
jgi:hypothetical protein